MQDETDEDWTRRVCYSVIGLQMLASLYDQPDSLDPTKTPDETVPMRHILNRGERLAKILIGNDGENGVDVKKIRNLYFHNGFMLHKRHRLAYPQSSFATVSNNMFLARGCPPWKTAKASGLGMLTSEASTEPMPVEDMFHIERSAIGDWFEKFLGTVRWETNSLPQDIEWLNVHESPKQRYWSGKQPKDGISLCRTKSKTGKDYFLWRISDGIAQQCRLPEWRTKGYEYLRIAIALRSLYNNHPMVTFKRLLNTVSVVFDYLPPPTEHRFMKLYSWSNLGDPFSEMVFAIDLFETIKTIFARLSYKIQIQEP